MAKLEIGKLLTTGTPKQRILLIAEEVARSTFNQENLLTEHEFNQLSDSFKKPNEVKLWNRFLKLDKDVTNGIFNLQGKKYEVLMHYSNLRGYILLWNSIEYAELLVNSVLHEIKDTKERKLIADNAAKGIDIILCKTEPDPDGYIEIKIDHESSNRESVFSLWVVMNNVKKEVESAIVKYKSWEAALYDFMEDAGFNVKTYKDIIKRMGKDVYTPIIDWDKYSGKHIEGISTKVIHSTIKRYNLCPNVEDLPIDEVEYNYYRVKILGDEKGR
jgi:hypothetical protein